MFKELIEAIQGAVVTETVVPSGEEYLTRPVHLPPKEPMPNPLTIHTLTGVVDYLNDPPAGVPIEIHILHPTTVCVHGDLEGRHLQRPEYLIANCDPIIGSPFKFGQWYDVEQFIIELLSKFEPTETRAKLLQVVGTLQDGSIRTHSDDGVTQSATAKTGITRLAEVELPNPVTLKPYRTFPEIEQPESAFVFRLRQGGNGPQAALFDADGGRWKLEAIQLIKAWLEQHEELASYTIIA